LVFLKIEAANAFQDVYTMFRRFEVDELIGCSSVVDNSAQLGSAEAVCVRGRCMAKNELSKTRMERGIERWTTDCICGAKNDDGDRMLAWDKCGVWRRTICSDIHDTQPVPIDFICLKCQNSDFKPISIGNYNDKTMTDISGSSSSSIILACTCRDRVAHYLQIYECLKRKIQMLKYEINLQKQVQTCLVLIPQKITFTFIWTTNHGIKVLRDNRIFMHSLVLQKFTF